MRTSKLITILTLLIASPLVLVKLHLALVSRSVPVKQDIEVEFKPFYEAFLKEARTRGYDLSEINVIIKKQVLQPNSGIALKKNTELGSCRLIIGMTPSISIDSLAWSRMTPVQKEMTVFHELGHCFLLKGHSPGLENEIKSLMNPSIFNQQVYLQNREFYLNELFSYKPYHLKDYINTFLLAQFWEYWANLNSKTK